MLEGVRGQKSTWRGPSNLIKLTLSRTAGGLIHGHWAREYENENENELLFNSCVSSNKNVSLSNNKTPSRKIRDK